MDHRFPPLRPQSPLPRRKPFGPGLLGPAPFDLTFLVALVLVGALALV